MSIPNIAKYFEYRHLPKNLQEQLSMFHRLAWKIIRNSDVVDIQERDRALRKLLEAKDCYIRSLSKMPGYNSYE